MSEPIVERPPRPRVRWTEAEDEVLLRLRESGMGFRQIADHLPGRTWEGCRERFGGINGKRMYRAINRKLRRIDRNAYLLAMSGPWLSAEGERLVAGMGRR